MSIHYEVIIVGAGPAGASLATRLAQSGRQVLLIDQSTFPRAKVCGECLAAGAWQQLDELGLAEPVARLAGRPNHVRIVARDGQSVELTLRPRRLESIVTISRYELDRLLVDRAVACGVELLPKHRVRRVLSNADGVCGIEVTSSASAGSPFAIGCRMLIAADGRHSHIVQQTGQVYRRGPKLVGFKTHLPADGLRLSAARVEMHSFAGGYLGVCQIENGMINVCGLLPSAALRASRGSVPLALASLLTGRDDAMRQQVLEATSWQTTPHVQRQWAMPRTPGVLYVGDAQGTIEPLAGQGIAMALEGAAVAAAELSRRVSIDGNVQQAYVAKWHSRYGAAIGHAARFGWLLRHPRMFNALISMSPLPSAWQSAIAHEGYVATRLRHS